MSCMLRLSGSKLDMEAARRILGPRPDVAKAPSDGRRGYLSYCASSCDGHDLPGQIAETIEFLELRFDALAEAFSNCGVESGELDFMIVLRVGHAGVEIQVDRYPEQLLKLAAELGLSICSSIYKRAVGEGLLD